MRAALTVALAASVAAPAVAVAQAAPINVRVMWSNDVVGPAKIDTAAAQRAFAKGFTSNNGVRLLPPVSLPARTPGDTTPEATGRRVNRIQAAQYMLDIQLMGTSSRPAVSIRIADIETSYFDRETTQIQPGQDLLVVLESLGRNAAQRVVKQAHPK